MAITFNEIPTVLRTPGAYTEFDASRALSGLAALPSRILIVGSMDSSAGTSAVNTLQPLRSRDDGIGLFGRGTQLAHMIDKAKRANPVTEMWAIGLDDAGAGTNSAWTLTFGGTATEDGVIHLLLGGRSVSVAVSTGDDGSDIAAAADAAVDADLDLAFTAASAAAVCTLTSRHAGEFTADLDVRVNYYDRQTLPAGVTLAIAQSATGATNPDADTILDALPDDQHFTTIITGWRDAANMTSFETHAALRWGPLVQQDQQAIAAATGSFSDLTTLGGARNSRFSSLVGMGATPSPDYECAAVLGAVDEKEPDPARPRQTLWLPNLLAPAKADRFDQTERNLLLQQGIATVVFDQSGKVYIERLITTYQTNALGIDDPTFLDITTLRTLAALRYTLNVRIQLKYPRHKLAADGTLVAPGQPVVTPAVIKGEIIALFDQWTDQGWTEGASKAQFVEELTVERDGTDLNRVNALIPPDLMNQFRVFAGQIQFLL